jgi:hypothetical protein
MAVVLDLLEAPLGTNPDFYWMISPGVPPQVG